MSDPTVIFGLVCIAAAITGGGLEAKGVKIPVISSLKRQIILIGFGAVLIIASANDAIVKFIRGLYPVTSILTASLNAGVGQDTEIVCGHLGSIAFHLDQLVPSRGSNGDNIGVHVRICPPGGGQSCPWGQLAKGQSLKVECAETGEYSINIFNFQINPPVYVKATITNSR